MRILYALIFIVVGVLIIQAMPHGPQSPSAPHEATGCSASRRAVEARLKAPGSAKWIDCRSTTSAGVQTVTLTVDSHNDFGALVRSRWITKVRNNAVEYVSQAQ